MACLHPMTLKKESGEFVTVPCGKCIGCLQRRRNDWSTRLEYELEIASSAWFVTLTYNDKEVPVGEGCLTLCKRDVQLFMKRLRKTTKNMIRYYMVGEYGENTQRPHYHAIIFNVTDDKEEMYDKVVSAWRNARKCEIGHIDIGNVTPASIAYVTKYMIQLAGTNYDGREKPFSLMSRRPGIGHDYLRRYEKFHKKDSERNYVSCPGGSKRALPRYYKEKIYSKFTRQVQGAKAQKSNEEKYEERKRNYEKLMKKRNCKKDFDLYEIEQIEYYENNIKKSLKNRKL